MVRFDISICECELGPHPHLNYEETPEGKWVKWEEVETLLYGLLGIQYFLKEKGSD